MPLLQINSCVDCPHHEIDNSGLPNDCDLFGIYCDHEDQKNKNVYHAKISRKHGSIYFNCPLENKPESED